jgi:hypothetical protein
MTNEMPSQQIWNDQFKECAMKNLGLANRRCPARSLLVTALLAILVVAAIPAHAQNDLQDQGGPVMQQPRVFLIFWLPTGQHFDPGGASGDTTYENLMQRFFTDVSGTSYLNIMSQYPGLCSPPALTTTQPCFGGVTVGGTFVDTHAYPHSGSASDPLQDSDVRTEVTNFITANSLTPGLNTEFFVFTAAGINECAPGIGCTVSDFCAYHDSFQSGGNTVIYSFMPNDNSLPGCDESVSAAPNLLSADREIVATSHEFSESITDPRPLDSGAWQEIGVGGEIGDICVPFQVGLGPIASDHSNVHLNGNPYVVQEEWSNDDAACVLSFSSAITGPSLEYTVGTGGDDLRSDSSAASGFEDLNGSVFQNVTLKSQSNPVWDNSSTHVRVFQINQPQPSPLANVGIMLTSHNNGVETQDNWNIQTLDLKVRNPDGTVFCDTSVSGNPAARLTGQAPTAVFPTLSCAPPPPPASIVSVAITVTTGNDNARSDTELWATFTGEPAICLKPSNNADADGVCNNGGSATDQNGQQDWGNGSTSTQTFSLATPRVLDGATLTLQLIEHNSGVETDDNWDIQSISVTGKDTNGVSTLLLSLSNSPVSGDNCMARLRGAPNPSSVTYNLSASHPSSAQSNPTFGLTPPGSCPQ